MSGAEPSGQAVALAPLVLTPMFCGAMSGYFFAWTSPWKAYSAPWQRANLIRTCASGVALSPVALMLHLSHEPRPA